MVFRSASSEATKAFAGKVARRIARLPLRGNRAQIITLAGNLGAGKTTFIQGFAKGLGLRARITSPTFVIMKRYTLKKGKYRNLFHLDAYRMGGMEDLLPLGMADILSDPHNIVLIEWAANVKSPLLTGAHALSFAHGVHEDERRIVARITV